MEFMPLIFTISQLYFSIHLKRTLSQFGTNLSLSHKIICYMYSLRHTSAYSEYNAALLHNIVNNSAGVSILVFCNLYFIILLNVKEKRFLQRFLNKSKL